MEANEEIRKVLLEQKKSFERIMLSKISRIPTDAL